MTWLGDRRKHLEMTEEQRTKLQGERDELVEQVKALQKKAGTHKTIAAQNFWKEDLTALATKIRKIDEKLGRC